MNIRQFLSSTRFYETLEMFVFSLDWNQTALVIWEGKT